MKTKLVFIAAILTSVVSMNARVHADITVFMNSNVGVAYQQEQESFFLDMLNDPNVSIDFDDHPTGTISGTEWQSLGVAFSQPDGGGLVLVTADENRTPQSLPNALWPSSGNERFEMTFGSGKTAVGFWLIDSEYNEYLNDTIDFFDSEGNLLLRIPVPFTNFTTNSTEANFFIGVISNIPLARVLVNELGGDNESVGLDNLYIEGGAHLGCVSPPGDINKDCKVNLEDFAILAAYWLVDCDNDPNDPDCAPY